MTRIDLDTESPFFRWWAELVVQHRLLFSALIIVITGLAGWKAQDLQTDMNVEAFMDQSSDELEVLETFRDYFGRDDVFVVLASGDVFTAAYLDRLRALHDEIAALDMEIPSLGQRRTAREAGVERASPAGSAHAAAPPAAEAEAGEDGFGDFGDDDDDFGDFGDFGGGEGEGADDWAGEAGGTFIDEIISLVNVRRTRGRVVFEEDGDSTTELRVGDLMDPWPAAEELPAFREDVLGDPKLVGQVVDAGGRLSVIAVRTQFMDELDSRRVNGRIEAILADHQAAGFELRLAGMPALGAALTEMTNSEIQKLFLISSAVVALLLFGIFRHVIGLAAPLVIVFLSMIWAFGFMALLGLPLTVLTNVLPAFLVAVGVGDTIHVQSVYRDLRARQVPNHDAIIHAVASTGKPVAFTTMTTMFGLLSFHFATIDAVGEMGTAVAFGVFTALVHSLIIVPVVLTWNHKSLLGARPLGGGRDRVGRFLDGCAAMSGRALSAAPGTPVDHRRRRTVLLGAALIAVISGLGISQIRVWHNPLSWVPDDKPVKVAFEQMDATLGGTANVQLLVHSSSPHGMKDLDVLRGLDALEAYLRDYEDAEVSGVVGQSTSLLDVVKETNRALHGGSPDHYRLPETQAGLSDTLFLFEQAGPSQLRRLATADLSTSQMTVRVKWLEATAYGPLTEYVDAGIERLMPATAEVRTTGAAYTLFTTVSGLIWNLVRSFSVAFAVITLIMIALLRDVRLGLIAMVPNLLPIAFVLGLMGFLGIPIDMSNILIASIAIGLAVDDTIHFLHRFKVQFDAHGDVEAAIEDALTHAGRAIVSTTATLTVGYLCFLGSDLISLQRFGYLLAITVVAALLFDLIFGPALLRTVYHSRTTAET